ncbi:MAG: hypothetical protein JOS17DRAFT_45459 [Linnemannia elongata]|nr:MAG: hypothetical protein JOS17DRAFT_45459 [Linnemannia elongata]
MYYSKQERNATNGKSGVWIEWLREWVWKRVEWWWQKKTKKNLFQGLAFSWLCSYFLPHRSVSVRFVPLAFSSSLRFLVIRGAAAPFLPEVAGALAAATAAASGTADDARDEATESLDCRSGSSSRCTSASRLSVVEPAAAPLSVPRVGASSFDVTTEAGSPYEPPVVVAVAVVIVISISTGRALGGLPLGFLGVATFTALVLEVAIAVVAVACAGEVEISSSVATAATTLSSTVTSAISTSADDVSLEAASVSSVAECSGRETLMIESRV